MWWDGVWWFVLTMVAGALSVVYGVSIGHVDLVLFAAFTAALGGACTYAAVRERRRMTRLPTQWERAAAGSMESADVQLLKLLARGDLTIVEHALSRGRCVVSILDIWRHGRVPGDVLHEFLQLLGADGAYRQHVAKWAREDGVAADHAREAELDALVQLLIEKPAAG